MKKCYYQTLSNPEGFQYWLSEKLAPVLLGAKPAEILCFSETDEKGRQRVELLQAWIERIPSLEFRRIKGSKGRIKILFYHKVRLTEILKDPRCHRFLKAQGYPPRVEVETYLDCLLLKISAVTIPPEIGIFLGYPLKDVLGYMGHPSLRLTKVNGWKVYGNPRVSDQIYEGIEKAKSMVRDQLSSRRDRDLLEGILGLGYQHL